MLDYSYKYPYYIEWYVSAEGTKINEIRTNIPFQVASSKIETGEVLDNLYKVQISGMTEIDLNAEIVDINSYKVDYNLGTVYFHSSQDANYLNLSFQAKGKIKISAKNVLIDGLSSYFNGKDNLEDALNQVGEDFSKASEQERSRNEDIRLANENQRIQNENVREANEDTRIANENDRINQFSEITANAVYDDSEIIIDTTSVTTLNNNIAKKTDISYVYSIWNPALSVNATQWKDLVFGTEYLSFFQNKTRISSSCKVVFSGDETTGGASLATPTLYALDKAFLRLCNYNGLSNISTINNSQSGKCTEHWNQTYVLADIATNPDLIILRWGLNDPKFDSSLNELASDGTNYNIRRTATDFYNSLDAGLAKLRNAKSYNTLSVILMAPNSSSDDLSFRNEAWHEAINDKIRTLARKYQCCFIDTYRLYEDSRHCSGNMASANNGYANPLDIMNINLVDNLFNIVFPKLFLKDFTSFNIWKAITLQNGWANYGNGFTSASYTKKDYNTIEVKGMISAGTITVGTIIGQLPYTFLYKEYKTIVDANGIAVLLIDTAGYIKIQKITTNTWVNIGFIISV